MNTFSKKLCPLFLLLLLMTIPFFAQAQILGRGALSLAKVIAAKSLASFEKGELTVGNLDNLVGKEPAIIVLYDNIAPWAASLQDDTVLKTGNELFDQVLAEQQLVIVKRFELDEMNNGLILEAKASDKTPDFVAAARRLSKVDYVLRVHLKEISE